MSAWLEVHQTLVNHSKTLRAACALGASKFEIIGALVALWSWSMDHAEDGQIDIHDWPIIVENIGWRGNPSELLSAMLGCGKANGEDGNHGFIVKDGNVLRIHDWDQYAGRLLDKRRAHRERNQRARSVRAACAPTEPNRTKPNLTDITDLPAVEKQTGNNRETNGKQQERRKKQIDKKQDCLEQFRANCANESLALKDDPYGNLVRFARLWSARYLVAYTPTRTIGIDLRSMSEAIAKLPEGKTIGDVMDAFFASNDKFIANRKHCVDEFNRQIANLTSGSGRVING